MELDVGQARLLAPGEGEAVSDTPERELRILSDHELLNLTWTRHVAGERGAEPHVHLHHTDAFYVLAGEVTFGLGPELEKLVAPAGTLVLVPPGVVHGFDNDGPAETRFLNIHAPSGGFAEHLRGRPGFDSHEPPEDGGRPASDALVRGPGEGELLELGPSTLLMKAQVGDGNGTFYLGELTLAEFPGPVPHVHEQHLDSFFVLDGTLRVRLGDETVAAPAGSYAVAPPGNVHTFSNPGGETVRALNIMAPGGFEQYLKEAAAAGSVGSGRACRDRRALRLQAPLAALLERPVLGVCADRCAGEDDPADGVDVMGHLAEIGGMRLRQLLEPEVDLPGELRHLDLRGGQALDVHVRQLGSITLRAARTIRPAPGRGRRRRSGRSRARPRSSAG